MASHPGCPHPQIGNLGDNLCTPRSNFLEKAKSQIIYKLTKLLFQMKGIIIISFVLLLSLTNAKLQINTQQQAVLTQGQGIELSCVGANGAVNYEAASLPQGVVLQGHMLQIQDSSQATQGYYPVQIKAQDSTGQSAQRIIVISIKNTSESQIKTETNQAATQTETAVQALQADAGVSDFLNTLDISTEYTATDYSAGYPTLQLPTGSVNTAVNYVTRQITLNQAQPSAANRNTITAEDVRAQGTFQRQFNAAKALGNLLAIIKQATANKNVAQEEVQSRTTLLNEAVSKQQEAALAVEDADRNYQRAQAGVNALNQQATDLKTSIAQFEADLKEKQLQRESTQTGIAKAQEALAAVNADLDAARGRLAETAAQLADKEVECNGLNNQLGKAQDELAQRPAQRERLESSLQSAKDKVTADEDLVSTLLQRLADAEAALNASKQEVDRLSGELAAFITETAKIQARVNDLTARFAECQEEYARIEAELNRIKDEIIPVLEQNAFDIQNEISSLEEQLATLEAQIAELPKKIAEANESLKNVQERLQYLRGQVLILQRILREAYLAGNAAANAVAVAKENLNAAIARLESEEKIIDEATLNLEKARIEKEAADLAVENLLKEGADILPYAAAPSGTGVTEDQGAYGITGWNSFVAEAFGSAVKPLFTGDLATLYPWKFQSQDSNLRQDEQSCAETGLTSLSGYVLNTEGDTINMIDSNSGSVYEVKIADCTLNLANEENYTAQSGDIIVVKGQLESNVVSATQTACVRR